MAKRYVLVADDDPLIVDLLLNGLRREGLQASGAGDGRATLDAVRQRRPDVLVLDSQMPLLDGFSVLRTLRAVGLLADVPVMMVSGRRDSEHVREAYELGIAGYIAKPFDMRLLLSRLKVLIERSSPIVRAASSRIAWIE